VNHTARSGLARIRGRYLAAVLSSICLVLAGAGAWEWSQATKGDKGDLPTSTPSCSWPLRIRGHPIAGEAGLVRCYLRALARDDMAGLSTAAWFGQVTKTDMAHSADARAGTATATFAPNESDSADTSLTITYANGATDVNLEIHEENPMVTNSWRILLPGIVSPGGPPAATRARPSPGKPTG
jgi:hypothetical protein